MKVQPTGDRVLIRRDEAERVTKGGIALPETAAAKNKPRVGTVVAVGPGRRPSEAEAGLGNLVNGRMPVAHKPGQKVLFNVYGQHEIPGVEPEGSLLLVREEDILGVVEG